MSFATSLKLYAQYVAHYERQGAFLESLEDRPRITSFLLACEMQKTCKGTPLRRYLSLPLLRIPQYKLLLREVLKYTNSAETSHPTLLGALERIDEVAHFVDDAVAQASMHKRMLELQVEWHADILHTSRTLLKEVLVCVHSFLGSSLSDQTRPSTLHPPPSTLRLGPSLGP